MGASNQKQKRGSGGFAALPHRVLRSNQFSSLSPRATKLLMDLLSQYNGNNNGDLCAAMTLMKERGWRSNHALFKSRSELLETGFIVSSRTGGRNRPELFALTFYAVDECWNEKKQFRKHELSATKTPADSWNAGYVPDIKAAQQQKRKQDIENNIIDLEEHLEKNPDYKYAGNYRKGIEAQKKQLKN